MNAGVEPVDDLVSIVIPVFNGARYVGEAIESALAQSWPFIEVIVVDDGSDDGGATQRVLAGFGEAIRIVRKLNGGVATALNAGVAAMRGAWFSWLSHDDMYHPLKVERYLAALRDVAGPAIAFGDVDLVGEDGRLLNRLRMTRGFAGNDGRWAVMEGRLNGCAMLVPRSCFDRYGSFDPGLPTTQDYDCWLRFARHVPFVPVRESLVRSRVHPEQGSRTGRHLDEASLLWVQMLDGLAADNPDASIAQRMQWLRRVGKFLDQSAYHGARTAVAARLDALLAQVPVGIVAAARCAADLDCAAAAATAAGARSRPVAVIDATGDALAAAAMTDAARLRGLPIFRLSSMGDCPDPSDVLRAAATALDGTDLGFGSCLIAFLDPAVLPRSDALRQGLLTVAAGEADGWLPAGPASPDGALPDALSGMVIAPAALMRALADRGGSPLTALARDARLVSGGPGPATPDRPMPGRTLVPGGADDVIGREPSILAKPPSSGWPTLLMLVHGWGGGTIRYAAVLAQHIADRVNVLFAWGLDNRRFFISSVAPDVAELEYDLDNGLDTAVAALHRLKVCRINVLHSVGMDDFLDDFLDRLGVPFDLTLLDYYHFANGVHLTDETLNFVGDDALVDIDHPARRRGPPPLVVRLADRRIACSRDLASRVARLAPNLDIVAAALPEPGNPAQFGVTVPALAPHEVMRVLFLGRLSPYKGTQVVVEVAEILAAQGAGIELYCLGADEFCPAPTVQSPRVIRLLGGYDQDDLTAVICRLRPHLAWLPFTAPETHSFALSDAMLHGLPILAAGLGAVAERTRGRAATWVLTQQEATSAGFAAWLTRLRHERLQTAPRWLPTDHLPPFAAGFYARDYLRPLFQPTITPMKPPESRAGATGWFEGPARVMTQPIP